MSKWQPIETAPKDATEILGWDNEQNEIVLTRWSYIQQWNNPEDVFGWIERGEWNIVINPTHWMPPPKPPTK